MQTVAGGRESGYVVVTREQEREGRQRKVKKWKKRNTENIKSKKKERSKMQIVVAEYGM